MFSNKKTTAPEAREPFVNKGAAAAAASASTEVPRLESVQARIGSTVRIEGEIKGEENLQIDGTVKGSIFFEQHRVVISEHGLVEGEIKADVIEVFGKCKGQIRGRSQVTVYENGEVEGDISAPRVALESGARFKGSVDMGDEKAAFTPKGQKVSVSGAGKNPGNEEKSHDKSTEDVYGLNHVS